MSYQRSRRSMCEFLHNAMKYGNNSIFCAILLFLSGSERWIRAAERKLNGNIAQFFFVYGYGGAAQCLPKIAYISGYYFLI